MKKCNNERFKKHFDRVLRRLEKRYDDDKNYSDGRRTWPISGWKWSESGDTLLIAFGYGGFLILFEYEKPYRTFKASAQIDTYVPFNHVDITLDELIDSTKAVMKFELEITEPAEDRKEPVLHFRQGVKSDHMVGPDETRLFGELVRECIHHESCRELRVNFEVLVEYAERQAACRKIIEMVGDSLNKQFNEIKIAWPRIAEQ